MSGAEGANEGTKLLDGWTYTPLLKSEGGMDYSEYPGTTTLTFFEGDLATALPLLNARLMEILRANPWLVGRFIKNKDHENWQLRYPSVATEDHLNELLIHRQEEIGDGFPNISFREMATKLCPLKPNLIVSPGSALLNKDIPCSRFTVFPSPTPDGSGKAGFCLVASISHSAADGHTYYEILNMLAPAAEVWPFKVERAQDFFPELLNQSLGKEEQGWMMSCSLITSVTCSIMCGCKGQARQLAFEVDEAKVAKMKEEALQRNTSDPSLQVPFVSTNDILTSHFGIVSGQRIMMMAMDLRGRVPGVGRKDAGCYTARLVLDPKSFEDPRGIRKSLLGEKEGEFRRASNEPLPGCWENLNSRFGMVTNWASSFTGDMNFAPEQVKQHLHMPFYDPRDGDWSMATIFRPKPGKLAVFYTAKPGMFTKEMLLEGPSPLGASIHGDIFG